MDERSKNAIGRNNLERFKNENSDRLECIECKTFKYKSVSCSDTNCLFNDSKQHLAFHRKHTFSKLEIKLSKNASVAYESKRKVKSTKKEETCTDTIARKVDSTRFQSLKCETQFQRKPQLLKHARLCVNSTIDVCHVCGKSFTNPSSYHYHMKHVLLGIKEHTCNVCNHSFSRKHYLTNHMRIHTGERPYICDLCGKTFRTSASLFVHKRSHTNEYKFVCKMCGHRCRTVSHLKQHITVHTCEKKYSCDICDKSFSTNSSLTRHKATHSADKPFSCALCLLNFKAARYLKLHTEKKHFSSLFEVPY